MEKAETASRGMQEGECLHTFTHTHTHTHTLSTVPNRDAKPDDESVIQQVSKCQ